MEMKKESIPDYLQYDLIWQRVAPDLNPYPEAREALAARKKHSAVSQQRPSCSRKKEQAESHTASKASLEGLLDRVLAGRCDYLRYARCAPTVQGRCALQQMAAEMGEEGRRLLSYHYVTTGKCYETSGHGQERGPLLSWCQALRKFYQEEREGAECCQNLARKTEDHCLRTILMDCTEACNRRSAMLLRLLGCHMRA